MKTTVNLPLKVTPEERFVFAIKQVFKEYANEINKLEKRIKALETSNNEP